MGEKAQMQTATLTWAQMQTATATFGGSNSNNFGLPNGWRAKKTPKGRMFFVNDQTKTTQWNDPRPIPNGWRSGKTAQGRVFYIQDSTKTTTWNDPRPPINI